ncbi:MAG: hypothetical protein FJ398_00170 [Verrucomicrobia bacterium]|nr:hypothetical protein [Verrucomicrobiota bacterium]
MEKRLYPLYPCDPFNPWLNQVREDGTSCAALEQVRNVGSGDVWRLAHPLPKGEGRGEGERSVHY